MAVVKRVERMKEFFLSSFFTRYKMYVVYQKHVNVSIFFPEFLGSPALYPVY